MPPLNKEPARHPGELGAAGPAEVDAEFADVAGDDPVGPVRRTA
jgi:hypothetical protein